MTETRCLDINARELATHAARIRYLALAASSIAAGCTPAAGLERDSCVGYLLDTIEYLGEQTEAWAEALETALRGGV